MKLVDLLMILEWSVSPDEPDPRPSDMCCPYCQNSRPNGHNKTCKLWRWIKVLNKVSVMPSIHSNLEWLEESIEQGEWYI